MRERANRRAVVVALIATPLLACGQPLAPPALAMRFEVTRESLDEVGATLSAYALQNHYKFEQGTVGIDHYFVLYNEAMRISMGAGGWIDPALTTHEWPFEYQVHFYPTDPAANVEALAHEIGTLLGSIDGVRKAGPNFVPDKNMSEATP